MLLSKMRCDACGRAPTFVEWWQGELTAQGYPDWRHPTVAFNRAGLEVKENHHKIPEYYHQVFGRYYPEDPSFLCPQCQDRVMARVPDLLQMEEDAPPPPPTAPQAPAKPRFRLGKE